MPKSTDKSKETPGEASAKTYYACRRKIVELFGIEPQAVGGARESFEATILHLRSLIESGAMKDDGTTEKGQRQNQPSLGLEHFSQEHIVGALMLARDTLLASGIPSVRRRELITMARDLMVKDYGLTKAIMKPSAGSGMYSDFDAQMQKFFKRLSPQVKSFGAGPNDMVALIRLDGRDCLADWLNQNQRSISACDFILSHHDNDLREYPNCSSSQDDDNTAQNDEYYWIGISFEPELRTEDKKSRLLEQNHFFRRYFANYVEEHLEDERGSDFGHVVYRLLHYFCPERAVSGYGMFIGNSDQAYHPIGNSDFLAAEVNLFFAHFENVCFSCVMNTAPFDVAVIRNKNEEDWTQKEVAKALRIINNGLKQHIIKLIPDYPEAKADERGLERGRNGMHSGFVQDFLSGPFLGIKARLSFYGEEFYHDVVEISEEEAEPDAASPRGGGAGDNRLPLPTDPAADNEIDVHGEIVDGQIALACFADDVDSELLQEKFDFKPIDPFYSVKVTTPKALTALLGVLQNKFIINPIYIENFNPYIDLMRGKKLHTYNPSHYRDAMRFFDRDSHRKAKEREIKPFPFIWEGQLRLAINRESTPSAARFLQAVRTAAIPGLTVMKPQENMLIRFFKNKTLAIATIYNIMEHRKVPNHKDTLAFLRTARAVRSAEPDADEPQVKPNLPVAAPRVARQSEPGGARQSGMPEQNVAIMLVVASASDRPLCPSRRKAWPSRPPPTAASGLTAAWAERRCN